VNIGIIRISRNNDIKKLIISLKEIVTVLPTTNTGNTVIFYGDDDAVLEAFKVAELQDNGLSKSFTHMRDIDPRLIKAIIENKRLVKGGFYGILETSGFETIITAANVALMFNNVEIAEIQLLPTHGEKSFFVLVGDKKSVTEAINSAKLISMQTYNTLYSKEWRSN
jgi:hypothetical protein